MSTMKLVCMTAFLTTSVVANAQVPETGKNEYSLYVTGGLTNLVYNLYNDGQKRDGFGIGGGLTYSRNFVESWSASVGIELQTFSATASYTTFNETYKAVDNLGQSFDYNYTIKGYEERQSTMLLSIPMKVQYKIEIGRNMHYYAAAGLKLGFPTSAEAMIAVENVTSAGYYDAEMIKYIDLPQHGFFDGYKPNEQKCVIKTGFAAILSLESGIRFTLGQKTALYTGLYFDYAPNNMKQTNNKHLLNFNRDISYESVLNTNLADKLNLMSIGLKARFSLF